MLARQWKGDIGKGGEILYGVEIWGEEGSLPLPVQTKFEYVDLGRLPHGQGNGPVYRVYSREYETQRQLSRLGALLENGEPVGMLVNESIVIYPEIHSESETVEFHAIRLDSAKESDKEEEEDDDKEEQEEKVKAGEPIHVTKRNRIEPTEIVTDTIIDQDESATDTSTGENLLKKGIRSRRTTFNPPIRRISSSSATTNQAVSETSQYQKNKSLIQRVILNELRLRNIRRQDNEEEYKQLYHHTYAAAMFAMRKELEWKRDIPLDRIGETIDKILAVFKV
ncbi:hypothetical protein TRVA0_021S00628 [Trichomonascus vanleenenianus]|uniref:uncharacterized protein n=1 Tax=Trichomonascus vanleenenianus TaxID=2268995 RepID=UPI003ECAAFC4